MMRLSTLRLASAVLLACSAAACADAPQISQESERIDKPREGTPLITSANVARMAVPPAPPSQILDPIDVFLPAASAQLSTRLRDARARGVSVFIVTLPRLDVPLAQRIDKLEATARAYSAAWLGDTIGAIVLFDDESGLSSIEFSDRARTRYGHWALENDAKELLAQHSSTGLARDKLEYTADILTQVLLRLHTQDERSAHRQRIGNTIIALTALVGLALAITSALGKSPKPAAGDSTGAPF